MPNLLTSKHRRNEEENKSSSLFMTKIERIKNTILTFTDENMSAARPCQTSKVTAKIKWVQPQVYFISWSLHRALLNTRIWYKVLEQTKQVQENIWLLFIPWKEIPIAIQWMNEWMRHLYWAHFECYELFQCCHNNGKKFNLKKKKIKGWTSYRNK